MKVNVDDLIAHRNGAYADAWARTGEVLSIVAEDLKQLLVTHPRMFYPVVSIICKSLRILGSPDNKDHWADISGYAKLVLNDLESQERLGEALLSVRRALEEADHDLPSE